MNNHNFLNRRNKHTQYFFAYHIGRILKERFPHGEVSDVVLAKLRSDDLVISNLTAEDIPGWEQVSRNPVCNRAYEGYFEIEEISGSNKYIYYPITNDGVNEQPKVIKGIIIKEGRTVKKFRLERERDPRLRFEKLKESRSRNNGHIICELCSVDYTNKYQNFIKPNIDESCVDVHHYVEEISTYPTEGKELSLSEALKTIMLICVECHSIISRKRVSPEILKQYIKENNDRRNKIYRLEEKVIASNNGSNSIIRRRKCI